jgi:hypothetical protein
MYLAHTQSTIQSERDAFERVLPSLNTLDKRECSHVNLAAVPAAATMLRAWKKAKGFRHTLAPLSVGGLDVNAIEQLEDRILAFRHAHRLMEQFDNANQYKPELRKKCMEFRRGLWLHLRVLELREGLSNAPPRLISNIALIEDMRILEARIRERLQTSGAIPNVVETYLLEARAAADELCDAVSSRESASGDLALAKRVRDAAWTLALQSYRELHRWITFLRTHDGDAEEIVPNLFQNDGRRTKKAKVA